MTTIYDHAATEYHARYESVQSTTVHGRWLSLLPTTKLLVLDVGAGSGRDAAYLAAQGHEVVAAEPSEAMRALAQERHASPRIMWLGDALPALPAVYALDYRFDLILLSAVWMHVPAQKRDRAFRKLSGLLRPGGYLVITLRHGPVDKAQGFHAVSREEVEHEARKHALQVVLYDTSEDALGRSGITWETLVLRLPDDGTGALPLIRHIVVNDAKSSTYKLGLLRVLLRIADGARGMVLRRDETHVYLPFGLIALYWVRQYKRLVLELGFNQQPSNKKELGFDKAAFRALGELSSHDLRVGARFTGQTARHVRGALRDARGTIKNMPAHFITFPGSEQQIFPCHVETLRLKDEVHLDRAFLSSMGTFGVPLALWNAMSRYACWIEPAIVEQWCTLMQKYDDSDDVGPYRKGLTWLDPKHDTTLVRKIVEDVRAKGKRIYCVWSGKRLTATAHLDHCFPFAHWPNNDLWNLMPTHPKVNASKADRLPSAAQIAEAQPRILDWWHDAYTPGSFAQRFTDEVQASLPVVREGPVDYVVAFEGVQRQRIRLKSDQQLAEWEWKSGR